jgi:hypothetical protein
VSAPRLEFLDPHSSRVEGVWRGLEALANPPYFLSWAWVENWLACLPRDEAPALGVLTTDGAPTGAFFLGSRRVVRHHVVPSRALFLNTTGVSTWDSLCIEHNAVLCAPSARLELATLLDLLPARWDEIFLPALDRDAFADWSDSVPHAHYHVRVESEAAAPFVDLERVRGAPGGHLSLLSVNTRAQIRRAERAFGELSIEVGADERHAIDIYDELIRLHAQSWHERGQRGAFADPWFDQFHRLLITRRLPYGEIQLLRFRSRGSTIGCLYNLIAGGRVLFYQSGIQRFEDPHLKPGYVCHSEAVRYNAAAGHAVYDLLAPRQRYKDSLATGQKDLVWLRVQRPLARFAAEEHLRHWKRAVYSWVDHVRGGAQRRVRDRGEAVRPSS